MGIGAFTRKSVPIICTPMTPVARPVANLCPTAAGASYQGAAITVANIEESTKKSAPRSCGAMGRMASVNVANRRII
jgi:hypothetical protein